MIKKHILVLILSILLFLSGCSTIGSLAGAAVAVKTGNNPLLGSLVGGAVGQVVANSTGQIAGQAVSGAAGQVVR
ncbi:MAG: hypothetical protein KAH00_06885 [Cocleimonas sp.]|nr:hypothetical protein [Cocleimonas sp.]